MADGRFAVESMREVADKRIRPARAGEAVAHKNRPVIPSGPVRRLSGFDHATGQVLRYGVYGRGRYGACRYTG